MGTTAQKLQAILNSKADIKDAIEAKGVTVGDATLAEYAGKIGEIQQGGGEEEDYHGDVIFIDYDGTVVYRYTKAEFLALEEMPANPEKAGFTAQGWNWTLADAKTYVTECGMLVIGQMRVTSDGKTRIYITLDDPNYLSPAIVLSRNSSVDWGDGSPVESNTGSEAMFTHTYATTGDYVISTSTSSRIQVTSANAAEQPIYFNTVRKIHLNAITALNTYQFLGYHSLEEINLPDGLSSFTSGGVFRMCLSLKALVLPSSLAETGNYSFQYCTDLKIISLNKNTTFGNNPFSSTCSLKVFCAPYITTMPALTSALNLERVVMPSTVTALASNNFQHNTRLKSLALSDNITIINGYTVDNCQLLYSLVLPSETTTLKTRALQGAPFMEITIPSKVTSIETYALYSCENLRTVHMLPTSPPTAGTSIFLQSPVQKIYVPYSADHNVLAAYQTATNWSAYASYMEEEPS